MEKINQYCDFASKDILKDKETLARTYVSYMLSRTQKMFKYEGLPESIPQKELERLLQINGSVTIARVKGGKYDGELIAFSAGLGDVPNIYFFPTKAIVANPYFSANLEIGKDCVVIRNDLMMVGLMPMMWKYAYQLAEADISLKWALVNARVPAIVKADNDATAESAKVWLKDLEEGKKLGFITSKAFAEEGLSSIPYTNSSADKIKDLLEAHNFILSKWFNEVGLQSNYNMKREAVNSSETGMDEDTLKPFNDEMLTLRQEGWDEANSLFGVNVSVTYDSVWKEQRKEEKDETDKPADEPSRPEPEQLQD